MMTHSTNKQIRLWNRFAPGYAKRPVDDPEAYQVKLDKTAALMTPEMSVLEIGCGTGTTALYHAQRVKRIDALDFSPEMIAIARNRAAKSDAPNVRFHTASFEDWSDDHGPYDMLMAHSILHLVADLDATLTHARACLKPGAWFVSSTPCVRDMSRILALLLPVAGLTQLIPKVTALSALELQARIRAAGFEIQETWQPAPSKAVFIIARAV